MDTESLFMGLILLVICVVPFVFMHLKKTKKESILLSKINQLISQKAMNLDEYEFFETQFIGLDIKKKTAFYIHDITHTMELKTIDLKTHTLHLEKNQSQEGRRIKIHKMGFQWSNTNSKQQELWVVFDETKKFQLSGEIEWIEKWIKKIQVHQL